MEIQNIDFSIEEVLTMHRYWITNLYVEERRTDVEIVGLLQERRFLVTLSQVRRCIDEWGLVPQEMPPAPTILPENTLDEDWELIPSLQISRSPTPPPISYTPSDPNILDHYANKPLPSIPTSTPTNHLVAKSKKRKAPHTDRLKVTCHHGSLPSESHEAETTLDHVPEHPTPLETYAGDKQSHEILALGLDTDQPVLLHRRDTDQPVLLHRRAGQPMGDGPPRLLKSTSTRPRTKHRVERRKEKIPKLEKEWTVRGRDSTSPEQST